ncbi:hypothetical protein [Actinomadura macrotermitis]|nr:hypothetical protein [Actinomadura macrotermitis]
MNSGATPEWTRPDMPLPARPAQPAAPPPATLAMPAPLPEREPEPAPAPVSGNWHRFHYPVAVFLVAFAVTALAVTAARWSGHRADMAGYAGAGLALPALGAVKAVQLLLLLTGLCALLSRRDVWLLPTLFGWLAGFGVFAVLDVVKGRMLPLAEHGVYAAVFAALLAVSYTLSVKARVGGPAGGQGGQGPRPSGLSRTQEFALSAANRWQRAPQG